MQAIKDATWEMITKKYQNSRTCNKLMFIHYSTTMDCRIAPHYQGSDYEIHCMLPKICGLNKIVKMIKNDT